MLSFSSNQNVSICYIYNPECYFQENKALKWCPSHWTLTFYGEQVMTEGKPRQGHLPSAEWKLWPPKNPLSPDLVRQPSHKWIPTLLLRLSLFKTGLQSKLQHALRKKLPPKHYPVITDAPQPGSCSHHHGDLLSHTLCSTL